MILFGAARAPHGMHVEADCAHHGGTHHKEQCVKRHREAKGLQVSSHGRVWSSLASLPRNGFRAGLATGDDLRNGAAGHRLSAHVAPGAP